MFSEYTREQVQEPSSIRVAMVKSVANRWVHSFAKDEYRFTIFGVGNAGETKKFASLLRTWRDGKLSRRISSGATSTEPIPDLGVREQGDSVEIWSSDLEGLRKIAKWAEERELETSFIW